MYLDKHDIVQLKKILGSSTLNEEFTEYLYLIYRRTEDGELDIACGYDEIEDYKLSGRDDGSS